jgi:hypothetical protein
MAKTTDLAAFKNETKNVPTQGARTDQPTLTIKMDEYAIVAIEAAWDIYVNPSNPLHNRFGFDALKILLTRLLPKRNELSGPQGAPVELSFANMFHKNSLPDPVVETTATVIGDDSETED